MVHLGIIPDGNRRWCKKNKLELTEIIDHWLYNMVLKYLQQIINQTINNDTCKNLVDKLTLQDIITESENFNNIKNNFFPLSKINEISIYISSIDNMSRDDNTIQVGYEFLKRLDYLLNNTDKFGIELNKDKLNLLLSKIKINLIGELDKIPPEIINILNKYQNNSKEQYIINIAIAYNYLNDLTTSPSNFYKRNQSNIDIVFRSGGEMRLSGFFPTKVLYSELYFCKKLWPDINLEDIKECILEYYRRNRRFGK